MRCFPAGENVVSPANVVKERRRVQGTLRRSAKGRGSCEGYDENREKIVETIAATSDQSDPATGRNWSEKDVLSSFSLSATRRDRSSALPNEL